MNVFVTRTVPPHLLTPLSQAGHEIISWSQERELTDDELINACQQADALLFVGHLQLDRTFFSACPHLKVIALNSVGYDHVDLSAANEMGIPIGNTPDVLSKATADTAFLLLQMVARKAVHLHKRILRGQWGAFHQPLDHVGIEFEGKTLGVYGLGRIGLELAKSCQAAFDMEIIYHNRNRNETAERELAARYVSFEELLAESDVISVHANMTPQTAGVFDKQAFSAMKRSSIFINTARGGLHNENDLLAALRDGTIWGAGLDVTNPEPMDKNHPLLELENCVVLPHIGSATIETRTKMLERCVENLLAGLAGKRLPYCVNPEVEER